MLPSKSNDILIALTANLKQSLAMSGIVYENYQQDLNELDTRKDFKFARIALYEVSEEVTNIVDDDRMNLSTQTYAMDISVVRGYIRDDMTRGEFPANALKDRIMQWAKSVNASLLTNSYIYTFGYRSASQYIRNRHTVTRTITFSAVRDLSKNQIE